MKKLFKTYPLTTYYQNSASTTYATTSYNQRFLYDTNVYDTDHLTVYFECTAWNANAGATTYARLYNETDGAAVENSEVTTASTTAVRLRSSGISLTNGKRYVVQLRTSNATYQADLREARLIFVWDSDTAISKFAEIIPMNSESYQQTGTTATQTTSSNLWTYNSGDYDGTIAVEFVTLSYGSSSARGALVELYDITASSVTTSTTVNATASTLSTATGVSLTNGHQYCVRLKRSGGTTGNVYVTNAYIILKQSGTITKTVSNVFLHDYMQTFAATTWTPRSSQFYYDPALLEGNTVTAHWLATHNVANAAATGYFELSDADDTPIYGSVTTTSTAKVNNSDTSVTLAENTIIPWAKTSSGTYATVVFFGWLELKCVEIAEVALTVANLDCAVTEDAVETTHTDGPVLAVGNLDCAVTEGAVSVTTHLHLTVGNLDCAVTEGAVVLSDIVLFIDPDNATLSTSEGAVVVIPHIDLAVGNLDCSTTIDAPVVVVRTTLSVGDLDCAVISDNCTLEAITVIDPDNAILATTEDGIVVTYLTPLTVGDLDCSVIEDAIVTSQTVPHWDLTVGNLDVAVISDNVGVHPTFHLIVADLDCAVISDEPVPTFRYVLITQGSDCSVSMDNVDLVFVAVINPDSAVLATTLEESELTVKNPASITPNGAILATSLEEFVVTVKLPVTINPASSNIIATTMSDMELFWFNPVLLVVANLDVAVTMDGDLHTTNENYQLLVVDDIVCVIVFDDINLEDYIEYVDISGLAQAKQRRIHKRLHRPSKGEKGRYYYCPHCMHIIDSKKVDSKPHNRVAYYKMHSDTGEDIWVPNVIDGCPLCGKGKYK